MIKKLLKMKKKYTYTRSEEQKERIRQYTRDWYVKQKENQTFKIYILRDDLGTPFYVGYTRVPLSQRKTVHIYNARHDQGNKDLSNKVFDVISNGQLSIEIIDIATDKEDAMLKEKEMIAFYSQRYTLYNKRSLPTN